MGDVELVLLIVFALLGLCALYSRHTLQREADEFERELREIMGKDEPL